MTLGRFVRASRLTTSTALNRFVDTDTLELGVERAQRFAVIEDVVDDEHRAARERLARPHAPRRDRRRASRRDSA